MYFVYAIQSLKDGRIYVGLSQNYILRLEQHNKGMTFSTKGYRPWKLIYNERFQTRLEARSREIYLKSGIGKEFLKNL